MNLVSWFSCCSVVFQRDRTVDKLNIFNLAWLKSANFRFDLENVFLQDGFFVSLFFSGLARVSPKFLLNFIVRRKLETIIETGSSTVFYSYDDFSGPCFAFGWYVPKVPFIVFEFLLKSFSFWVGEVFDSEVFFLFRIQFATEFRVDFLDLEVFPKSCNA